MLCRLHEVGRSNKIQFADDICSLGCSVSSSDENARKTKGPPHCSLCGHPGSKRMHLKFPCEYCKLGTVEGCLEKPVSFKCNCSSCDMVHFLHDTFVYVHTPEFAMYLNVTVFWPLFFSEHSS